MGLPIWNIVIKPIKRQLTKVQLVFIEHGDIKFPKDIGAIFPQNMYISLFLGSLNKLPFKANFGRVEVSYLK